ncbi:hypothetical protein C5Z26_05585 [Lactobacillus sp. CBA3606]|uniref:2'-5' RNA ligase family protein n=1 Tax=Lactobacillus sp. CBA3606 TaxID=2099789 RepID=UPI000CFC2091|nr:2'-5' RNA ligase family protein [Lactobacillus sp. CBA3606]AVK63608.1 hypothetical protein C5Z26_05585 [Lactobacillus sp. CBA3606]
MERSVLIFPDFDNINQVQRIRQKYDSLYAHVRPHISLIFPFESESENGLIFDSLCEVSHDVPAFSIDISKVSGDYENGYVWLEIGKSKNKISSLHRSLYDCSIFSAHELRYKKYVPHITIAQGLTPEKAVELADELNKQIGNVSADVKSISVEKIRSNGDSIEIFTKKLLGK